MAKYIIVQFDDSVDISIVAVAEQVMLNTLSGVVAGKMDFLTPEPVLVEHEHDPSLVPHSHESSVIVGNEVTQ